MSNGCLMACRKYGTKNNITVEKEINYVSCENGEETVKKVFEFLNDDIMYCYKLSGAYYVTMHVGLREYIPQNLIELSTTGNIKFIFFDDVKRDINLDIAYDIVKKESVNNIATEWNETFCEEI